MASTTLPPFTFANNEESTRSLLSRRGSEYGSHFSLRDESGIYISPLAMTIIVSCVAVLGIILVALVVTLAVMLVSCEKRSHTSIHANFKGTNLCASFHLNAELNNLQGWTVPNDCEGYVSNYMMQQYYSDFATAVAAASIYLGNLVAGKDGQDVVVLDIDETALSNVPYYQKHHYGAEEFNEEMWNEWVEEAAAPALAPMLALYKQLLATNWKIIFITGRPELQWNTTTQNLLQAGYEGWSSLILRAPEEVGLNATIYKSRRRRQLEKQGYRIGSALGDQWSDIIGPAVGGKNFKLPNPMYYIF